MNSFAPCPWRATTGLGKPDVRCKEWKHALTHATSQQLGSRLTHWHRNLSLTVSVIIHMYLYSTIRMETPEHKLPNSQRLRSVEYTPQIIGRPTYWSSFGCFWIFVCPHGIKKHSAGICTRDTHIKPAFCIEEQTMRRRGSKKQTCPSAFVSWLLKFSLRWFMRSFGRFRDWCLIGDGKHCRRIATGNFCSKGKIARPRPSFSLISLQSKQGEKRRLCSVHRQGQETPKSHSDFIGCLLHT